MQLTLFFTKGVSLGTWNSVGMLSREIAIYRALEKKGIAIRFVSYGGREESQFTEEIAGIELKHNRWNLPIEWYARSLVFNLPRGGPQIFKSNQMNGAEIGLRLARSKGAKFIARSGYLHSLNTERSHGMQSGKAQKARELEQHVYAGADRIVVTTQSMRETIRERYDLDEGKIRVIPNYVQTDVFAPIQVEKPKRKRVIFVGRLSEEKNLDLLIRAMEGVDAELCLVGEGYLREELIRQAEKSKADVRFLGAIPNTQLPELLNSGSVFILPSKYEGHPKALLEAMACQMAVVGSNVSGIREIIQHEQNGLLCEEDPESIREAINHLLASKSLRSKLGKAARKGIEENFSLEHVCEMEFAMLQELVRA